MINFLTTKVAIMRTPIYATFDTKNETWNVIKADDKTCLFYGNIEQLEIWLVENKDTHIETTIEYEKE
jgi:hypothetical protein